MGSATDGSGETFREILEAAEAASTEEDLKAAQAELQRLMKEGFVKAERSGAPYAAAIEMTDEFRERHFPGATAAGPEAGVEAGFGRTIGGFGLDAANALANAERRVAFRLKTLFGFDGVRLVEEGDSWTQYPVLLEDIGDHLASRSDFAVFSVGAAGDLVADMAAKREYLWAIERARANAMLLSGGGNDLFGDLGRVLLGHFPGAAPEDLIDEGSFAPLFQTVMASYRRILTDVAEAHPRVPVFGHGYDLPFPQERGSWMGPALIAKGIPLDLGREVLRVLMDRFNEALRALDAEMPNFVFCDLRSKVDRGLASWFDELHPRNAGYGRAAAEIEKAIRARISSGAGFEAGIVPSTAGAGLGASPERQPAPARVVVIDPGHGGTAALGGSSANNAIGPRGMLEKHVTLDIAQRARDILRERGIAVVLTRETDDNLSLADRAGVAKANGAAAFVSLHFNGFDGAVQGTETFVHSTAGTGSGAASEALCRAMQKEMVAALGHKDRNAGQPGGVKRGGFGVLRPTAHAPGTAAVLHEVCFMDLPDEEMRLAAVSYRRKIAVALADGIETFLAGALGATFETARAEPEIGDGFELGLHRPQRPEAAPATTAVASNGHRIAEAAPAEPLLASLADIEARFLADRQTDPGPRSEGEERSDASPLLEAVFGGATVNVESSQGLLRKLFARATPPAGFDAGDFEAFVRGLGLRHFSPTEFLFLGASNESGPLAGKNTLPPRTLWPRIANTARMLDEIRDRLDAPVFITSAYRSPEYNRGIGGAPASQHMNFNAIDWRCASGTPTDWRAVAEAVRGEDPGRFGGFIDDYDTFVHIDTRNASAA
jgi:N-acetylmuramoyl-L-alanine amidase